MKDRPLIAGKRLTAAALLTLFLGGCAGHLGTTAASFLRRVEESPDPNVRHLAYSKLADPLCYSSEEQKGQAVSVLSGRLTEHKEPVAARAQICRTLGQLERPEARPALLAALDDEDPLVRSEAVRAIGLIGSPEDAPALSRVMAADVSLECRMAAIDALGRLRPAEPRVTEQLLAGMEHDDPGIRLACYRSLRLLTGRDLGADPRSWRDALPDAVEDSSIARTQGAAALR